MKTVYCLSMLIVCCFSGGNSYSVTISESVTFAGCCPMDVHTKWMFDGEILSFNKILRNTGLGGNISISDNKSLTIGETSLSHEGTYECVCNDMLKMKYSLEVEGMYAIANSYQIWKKQFS